MDETQETTLKPPYGSFSTFWGFLDTLAKKPLPPQIDRSLFATKSGTDQIGIISALRWFGLVKGANYTVEPGLVQLVKVDAEDRKSFFVPLLRDRYPGQFEESEKNGTEKNLLDSFERDFGLTGDTRRKAMTFFLHAARAAGLTLSENFPNIRAGSGAPVGSRARRTKKRLPAGEGREGVSVGGSGGSGESSTNRLTIGLRAGGSVTLVVDVDHFALSRNKADRDFVQKLVDALTDYGDDSEGQPPGSTPADPQMAGDGA